MKALAVALLLAVLTALADDAGRKHPENDLLARPAIVITVGVSNASIIGNDKRAGEVTMEGNIIKAENQLSDERRKQ